MRVGRLYSLLGPWLVAMGLLSMSGCGSSSTANVVTVTVSSSVGTVLILGESTTLTATVNGATNTNVTWEPGQPAGPPQTPCTYTTTTTDSTGKSTTAAAKACPTDGSFGTLTNVQTTGTATYTAPSKIPDQTTFPGLQIIFTAQSQADTKKSGTLTITLDSGVSVVLTPNTATVPTNEPQSFNVQLTNDLQAKSVTWSITQQVPTATTPYPQLKTCSPTCGTITPDSKNPNIATYTAPTSVPTSITPADSTNKNSPANLTIVATSNADNTRLAIGTITIITGGPINFSGISPTIAPQGAAAWDIYLNAPNISSASQITLNFQDSANPNNFIKTVTFGSTGSTNNPNLSQFKVLFPIPITTTTNGVTTVSNPQSTGARLRLLASDMVIPPATGTVSVYVSITDPGQTVTPAPPTQPVLTANPYTFQFVPVRPTSIATVPDDVIQGKASQDTQVIVDGGYFGPGDQNLTNVVFQGTTIAKNGTTSTARQLNTLLPANLVNASGTPPGLYPLSVSNRATPAPLVNNDAVTNIAVFPDFSATPPVVVTSGIAAGTNPSAVDIDPILGVLVVADPGSNTVRFFSIVPPTSSSAASLTLLSTVASTPQAPLNLPTGLSVNRNNHTVVIVNYGSQTVSNGKSTITGQTVTVLNIPNSPSPITPFFVDISNALQGSVSPAPMPYSIGVDPDSNLAVVAYSTTSATSGANLGFIVNLNPNTTPSTNPYGCTLGNAVNGTSLTGQCLAAQVTLNTGQYPQIAMSRHGHVGLVTPGGSGVVRGVDVTKPSTGNVITSASLTAGVVTVTVDPTKCPNGVLPSGTAPNICPLNLIPGNAGSVLITGLVAGTAANNSLFNGVYSVGVTSSSTFTYVVNSTATDSASAPPCATATPPTCAPATVFYGSPGQIFAISATAQGVAINPITNTAAIADANAIGTNGPQIDLLSSLDQSISSISFFATCTAFTTPCSSAPELLGTTDVAWQPYTNAVVSYNPTINQVSVSDPVSRKRYALACNHPLPCSFGTAQIDPAQITLSGSGTATLTVQNGTINSLKLFGGLAVDSSTNQAFVVKSGSGTIDVVDLGSVFTNTPIKSAHVNELLVPSAPPSGCPQSTPGNPIVSGIPNTVFPQGTLTSTTDLCGVQILGSGFLSGGSGTTQVRLDSTPIPAANVTVNSPQQLTVTIPKSFLIAPHKYSLDVLTSGGSGPNAQSNAVDFYVVQAVDMSTICTDTSGNPAAHPSSVAIADQLANGPFSPIAVVSNTGCNSVSIIDINPTVTVGGVVQPNPNFGQFITKSIGVGASPQGIAISQRRGLAVVANNGAATASIIDLTPNPPKQPIVPDVSTGTNPTGVAINEATDAAIVANTGSNTVTMLDFGLLFPATGTPPTTLTPTSIGGIQSPIAVAIDPDRGTNNQGIAVVTSLQLVSGQAPFGALAVVEIGLQTPTLSTTIPSGSVTATPTGIVFDPFAASGTANPGLFFANSSGSNVITAFNPDTGGGSSVNVGINPTSLAVNPQTGAILTSNSASNTISIVDTLSNPLKTRQTFGIPGSGTFGVAVDQFTNLAIIVDQANNRVLLFPMPN
ncbi:MAG TPA: hypothetical protein VJO16_16600 [Candidatus Acidoferrum sp.]|nr:hypothetical protein [Candidatus Acidoferrum sp.]